MVEENGATKRHGPHEIQEVAASQSQSGPSPMEAK